MAAAWRRYREMVADRQLRDHLGLSAEQWENEPADFIDWARDFFEVERKVTQ